MKKIVSLDVHSQWSQVSVISEETGELLLEMKVRTDPAEMREMVAGLPGPKKVLFEEGPMSGMLRDALETPLPVPTCDRKDNRWASDGFWRGDVWPATSYQVAVGFAHYGYHRIRGRHCRQERR